MDLRNKFQERKCCYFFWLLTKKEYLDIPRSNALCQNKEGEAFIFG